MAKKLEIKPEQKANVTKAKESSRQAQAGTSQEINDLSALQQQVGNRAVQRLVAQRKGSDPYELDEKTAGRISQARSGGQKLDKGVQADLGQKMSADFSDVRVHTGPEAGELNQQLNARAFTTGSDIFFSEGAYNPTSSAGQELLTHELTHVQQQSSGKVDGGSGGMTVRAPGDSFEQQADATARTVNQGVQRQAEGEEEEPTGIQAKPNEGELIQQQEDEETKSELSDSLEEEEEPVQTAIQRTNPVGSSNRPAMNGIEEDEELSSQATQSRASTSASASGSTAQQPSRESQTPPAADASSAQAPASVPASQQTQTPTEAGPEQAPESSTQTPPQVESTLSGPEQSPEDKGDSKAKQTEDAKDKNMPTEKPEEKGEAKAKQTEDAKDKTLSTEKPEEKVDSKAKQTEDEKDKNRVDEKIIGEKLTAKDEEEAIK